MCTNTGANCIGAGVLVGLPLPFPNPQTPSSKCFTDDYTITLVIYII